MKRRKRVNDYLTPKEKQSISIEKAISIAVITVTGMLYEKRLEEKDYESNLKSRLDSIKRKFGFQLLKEILPEIIKRMEEKPKIKMNLSNGEVNIKLRFEYLIDYMKILRRNK